MEKGKRKEREKITKGGKGRESVCVSERMGETKMGEREGKRKRQGR